MFPFIRRFYYDNPPELYKDDGFRHEVKYTLTPYEYYRFRDFCAGFMDGDKNAGADGEYLVKSYYFDTLYFNDYTDKLSGIHSRQKYRLRTYNDTGYYRLEKKIKRGALNKKVSGEIDADPADMLIKGYPDIKTGNPGTDDIITEMRLKNCRNSVYVEYARQAFIIKELGIRITFDKDLGVLYGNYGLHETRPAAIPVFYDGSVILEVKYKDLLPKWLERAIYQLVPSECSVSKYSEGLAGILG